MRTYKESKTNGILKHGREKRQWTAMKMTSEVVKCTCTLACIVPHGSYVRTCTALKEWDRLTYSGKV